MDRDVERARLGQFWAGVCVEGVNVVFICCGVEVFCESEL